MLPRACWIGALALLLCTSGIAGELRVGVRGHLAQQGLFSVVAAPGETLQLELLAQDTRKLQLHLDGKPVGKAGPQQWQLRAPLEPGAYDLQFNQLDSHQRSHLNLLVGVAGNNIVEQHLNGYRMGPPPPANDKYPGLYRAPQTFVEVTEDTLDLQLSPHFTLRQFLCKQESAYPKYLVLKESLLMLLEGLLADVQTAGYPVETFGVISAYRTPYYNARIGNVANSRHVYGDAMDLFVDADGDGRMDDLNGDGELNKADVDLLYALVTAFKRRPENALLVGGVGRYYATAAHGGFIHVDTRGFRARW